MNAESETQTLRQLTKKMQPSTSTVTGAALGVPATIILVWAVKQFGEIEIPAEVAAAAGAILSAVIGYFFDGGKSADTK